MSQTKINTPIQIDGAQGEGGGQIIRTSVSLAAITGQTVEIVNIRAGRSKPGLQAQHLTSVLAAAALCGAETRGAELGSLYLRFAPGETATASDFRFDVAAARGGASAGATGLVAQTLLVPMAFLPTHPATATILGGTHVPMSPPADYVEAVYVPMLRRLGLNVIASSDRAGFFPRGGGSLTIGVTSGGLYDALDATERGKLLRLRVRTVTSDLPGGVAERGRDTIVKALKGYGVPIVSEPRDLPSNGAGAAMVLIAECERGGGGWTSLGERGKPIERVAEDAVRGFQKWFSSGAGVEEHLSDQLVLPCALTPGESRWTTPLVTEHLRTVLAITGQFLPIEYTVVETEQGGLVTLRGCAL